MSERELKLECIKIASGLVGEVNSDAIVKLAEALFSWATTAHREEIEQP